MSAPLRVAFVGSCQVWGLKGAAQRLLPDAVVEAHQVGAPYGAADIRERVAGFDQVITQLDHAAEREHLSSDSLAGTVGQAAYLPIFQFSGLHPDTTYVDDENGMFKGVSADIHSLIVLAGFELGLDAPRIERLFNAHVFSELGYFDAFPAARALLDLPEVNAGYAFGAIVDEWVAAGRNFMHTPNHPRVEVLARLARDVLAAAGHVSPDAEVPTVPRDDLDDWLIAPVFPSLARRIGIEGGSDYQRPLIEVPTPASPGDAPPPSTPLKRLFGRFARTAAPVEPPSPSPAAPDRAWPLRGYIQDSLDLYRSRDMSGVRFPRRAEVRDILERLLKT